MSKAANESLIMFDKNHKRLYRGDAVTFFAASRGTVMQGHVADDHRLGQTVSIQIEGDPFPVYVPLAQIQKGHTVSPRKTTEQANPERLNRRELRRLAGELQIPNWASMSTEELSWAVAEATAPSKSARKTRSTAPKRSTAPTRTTKAAKVTRPATKATKATTKAVKAPAKKAAPAKRVAKATSGVGSRRMEPAPNGNPFRPGTNMYLITEELIKGGSRSGIISRMSRKIDLHPWAKDDETLDVNFELDKRILLVAHNLKRKFGWNVEMTGRGPASGTIQVFPPGASKAPAKKATKAAKARKGRKAA